MSFFYKAIDHVQLAAPKGSEDLARDFYQNILGFEEVEKPELLKKNGGVWFSSGVCHVHIGIDDPFTPAKKAHPAFEVNDIEAFKKHLALKKVTFVEDDRIPGVKRFHVFDPFGNRIEIVQKV
ncbi:MULTISPECIES: VOC family protein [unclassified Bacillus (in: firmicutes)]|uniref:VOC family protein n=1 Tax=unclassified Bacillus (in: firmicutes) TaxID=185979 RepID=UPI0008E270CB|nr:MULTISPECIES: VOC family protein [unclassified Bacillus (in: firmicutes)]SFA71595.1 Catechol 2,3-dioxygenase [Bacillus sp. UNCCL13]SFQ61795.1 Catechol 2,3-dioxygenase [Bacillus sp. cl95]